MSESASCLFQLLVCPHLASTAVLPAQYTTAACSHTVSLPTLSAIASSACEAGKGFLPGSPQMASGPLLPPRGSPPRPRGRLAEAAATAAPGPTQEEAELLASGQGRTGLAGSLWSEPRGSPSC